MKELLELYFAFLKIGAVNFGGGYAMLPLLERDLVQDRGWTTTQDLTDYFAIGQCTPGLIALNVSTFIGSRRKGIPGAIAATLGMVLLSFVIIYAISMFFDRFLEIALIAKAFKGIKIGVGILILSTGLNMLQKMSKKPQPRIIAGFAFGAMLLINIFSLKLSTITLMLAAAAVSLGIFALKGGGTK